ncbi:MAG TPA: DUF6084 family protein [Candidatus Angelobacter sp.]|nr:DUF6084 family protein [Candidatus Angelobacter sp.]
MPELNIQVENVSVVPYAAAPTLAFKLRVTNQPDAELIHTIVLRCQIQLEVTRRTYTPEEKKRMQDIFGEPDRWSRTLRNLLWTHASVVVPEFRDTTLVDLLVPCTFDFNVAATKYFAGLDAGDVPLILMFSGTVFYAEADGLLQVSPISWQMEAKFRLPVKVWRDMMEAYYPNSAWLCLRRDVFDRLNQYKTEHGILTWEALVESLVPASGVSQSNPSAANVPEQDAVSK